MPGRAPQATCDMIGATLALRPAGLAFLCTFRSTVRASCPRTASLTACNGAWLARYAPPASNSTCGAQHGQCSRNLRGLGVCCALAACIPATAAAVGCKPVSSGPLTSCAAAFAGAGHRQCGSHQRAAGLGGCQGKGCQHTGPAGAPAGQGLRAGGRGRCRCAHTLRGGRWAQQRQAGRPCRALPRLGMVRLRQGRAASAQCHVRLGRCACE
jgi:hypothetical protein